MLPSKEFRRHYTPFRSLGQTLIEELDAFCLMAHISLTLPKKIPAWPQRHTVHLSMTCGAVKSSESDYTTFSAQHSPNSLSGRHQTLTLTFLLSSAPAQQT